MADLFQIAVGQQGYFTSSQAREAGVSGDLVKYHARTGRFIRVYRGVYRFRDYPPSPREEVAAAWLAVGKDIAVVSHESALDLLDLTDVIPYGIHITVPRSERSVRRLPGVRLHTTTKELDPEDVQTIDGVRVTAPVRSILDTATSGLSPEHVEVAVAQALGRGLTTSQELSQAARTRSRRVQRMVNQSIELASAS
jgi:predicted transcriptional regulator of viral defense system